MGECGYFLEQHIPIYFSVDSLLSSSNNDNDIDTDNDNDTVPLRRNLKGTQTWKGTEQTDTEQVQEREQNRYRTDIEQILNGYETEVDHKKGKKRSLERKL